MYDTLLLPTDGETSTNAVLDHVADVASRRDATVHVVYVVDDRAFLVLEDDRVDAVTDELLAEGQRAVAEAADALESRGVDATTEIRTGTPADEIVAAVDERGADLVVMGTHGDDPTRNLLGSTSQKVVTLAPAPVLTVPVRDDTEDDDAVADAAPAKTD